MSAGVIQEFSEEVTVIVWRNISRLGFIPTGHFGHAALMLRGQSRNLGQGEYDYISWWPKDGAGKDNAFTEQRGQSSSTYKEDMIDELSDRAAEALEEGRFQPRGGQTRVQFGNREFWGVHADAVNGVPAVRAANQLFGLDMKRMWDWFLDYRYNKGNWGRYKLASKTQSCSGVAAVALVEGGGEAFAKAPTARIYMEPRQVDEYGAALRKAIVDFNRRVMAFEGPALQLLNREANVGLHGGVTGFYSLGDLWDMATWKRQSGVGGSMRSSAVRKIDKRLTEYWRGTWDLNFKEKYTALVRVLEAVMEHRRSKPHSERALPVAQLGLQAIEVVRGGYM
jgi:hypothetical protein